MSDHPGDILAQIEAGYDEGPLLIVPALARPVGGRPARVRACAFRTAADYLAHLAFHADALEGERWVGIVRGAAKTNGETALAALQHIVARLAEIGSAKRRRLPSGRLEYATASRIHVQRETEIRQNGEAREEVLFAFPRLADITRAIPESNG